MLKAPRSHLKHLVGYVKYQSVKNVQQASGLNGVHALLLAEKKDTSRELGSSIIRHLVQMDRAHMCYQRNGGHATDFVTMEGHRIDGFARVP